MKKDQLKRELGRIRPREELITSTIAKVNTQKEKKERSIFSPIFSKGVRIASALCAFALVFCIGFAVARQENNALHTDNPQTRLVELDTDEITSGEIAMFDLAEEYENGWILISGNADSMSFTEISAEDKESGAIRTCNVSITASGLLDSSDVISVDIEEISVEINASVTFYDHSILESFLDMSCADMIFKLTPDGEGGWIIVDFAPLEK